MTSNSEKSSSNAKAKKPGQEKSPSTTYSLEILPSAEKEWAKLDNSVRTAFKKKLEERLVNPHVAKDKLREYPNHYKIKLKDVGYRLVYEVEDNNLIIYLVTVGRRDTVYGTLPKKIR